MDEITGSTLLLIALLLLVFVGAYYATKVLSGRTKSSMRGGYMRIKDSMLLGRDKQLILLEVGSKVYLLGISGQSVGLVGTLEKDELTPLAEQKETGSAFSGFREILQKVQARGRPVQDDRMLKRSRAFAKWRADPAPNQSAAAKENEPDDIDMLLQAIKEKNARNESSGNGETHEP
ncbi:MAG: flagellar biosynthetic protein FliO [Bacillota bacterium]